MSFIHNVEELIEAHGSGLTRKAAHWERVRLGDVAQVINGFPFPSGGFNNEAGEPVLRIRDIATGSVGTFFKGDIEGAPRVEHGDLVVGMDGDFNSRLWPSEAALINQRVCRIAPDEAVYSKRLLAYALPGYLKLVNDHTSAVTVKHLSSRTIADIPLPLPPRPEQDRLASKLDELFSRIDEGERALERASMLVERYRQSVLKAAVTGELTRAWREKNKDTLESGEALLTRILTARREAWEQAELEKMKAKGIMPANDKWKQRYAEPTPPNTSALPRLPDGWAWVTLPMLCSENSTNGISVQGSSSPPGIPALRLDAMLESGFNYSARRYIPITEDQAQRLAICEGDFFVSRANGSLHLVGRAVLASSPPEQIVFPDTMIRYRPLAYPDVRPWLAAVWPSRLVRDQLERRAKTTAGIYKVSQGDLSEIALPLPPLSEQAVAVSETAELMSRMAKLEGDLHYTSREASALRQATLKSAFTGSLVHQDLTDEPASTLLERIATERAAFTATSKRGRKPKPLPPRGGGVGERGRGGEREAAREASP